LPDHDDGGSFQALRCQPQAAMAAGDFEGGESIIINKVFHDAHQIKNYY
jgi:hypothetical protein